MLSFPLEPNFSTVFYRLRCGVFVVAGGHQIFKVAMQSFLLKKFVVSKSLLKLAKETSRFATIENCRFFGECETLLFLCDIQHFWRRIAKGGGLFCAKRFTQKAFTQKVRSLAKEPNESDKRSWSIVVCIFKASWHGWYGILAAKTPAAHPNIFLNCLVPLFLFLTHFVR